MAAFFKMFGYEIKRCLQKRILIVLLILIVLVTYVTYDGLSNHIRVRNERMEFQKLSTEMFTLFKNYTHYGFAGINIYFLPSTIEIFFPDKGNKCDINANVDSLLSLNIVNNLDGFAQFGEESSVSFRFSNIVMYIGTFLLFLWGYDLIKDKEYLMTISGSSNDRFLLIKIAFIRVLITVLIQIFILLLILFYATVNSVNFVSTDIHALIDFLKVSTIMLLSSFIMGMIIGALKGKKGAILTISTVWFLYVCVTPAFVNHIVSKKAKNITSKYKKKLEKVVVVSEFEKWVKKQNVEIDRNNIKGAKKLIDKFLTVDYKKLEKINDEFSKEIKSVMEFKQNVSAIFPTSFYSLVCSELSSHGHKNFFNLKTYLKRLQADFCRFWFDRVYYNDPKIIVNFLDENKGRDVFMAKPERPSNFTAGINIGIAWCIVLIFISYLLLKNSLHKVVKKKATGCDEVIVDFKPGLPYNLFCMDKDFPGILMNVFWGHPGAFNGKLAVNGENIVTSKKKDFLYFPNPNKLSVTEKAGDFMTLMLKLASIKKSAIEAAKSEFTSKVLDTPFNELEIVDKVSICLTIALSIPSPVYIFENFAVDINNNDDGVKIITKSKALIKSDTVVIDMFTVRNSSWLSKGQLFMTNYDKDTRKYSFSKHG